MQPLQVDRQCLQSDPVVSAPASTTDRGLIANSGDFIIIDDSRRTRVVKLITDLLAARIPVTMINNREQGLPFQEVFYDFDGKYVPLNPDGIDPASIDMSKDILLEIPGQILATYLQEQNPILGSIENMLVNRFTAFPLSFIVIEEITGIDNIILKQYLHHIIDRDEKGVQSIWSLSSPSERLIDKKSSTHLSSTHLLMLGSNTENIDRSAEKYDHN
jgi:hypothetical protein